MVALALTFLLMVAGFQPADGVSVTTSSSAYAPGATIDVTVENNGSDRVTRGGIVCELCRPVRREPPVATELVRHCEHGYTVRLTARAA